MATIRGGWAGTFVLGGQIMDSDSIRHDNLDDPDRSDETCGCAASPRLIGRDAERRDIVTSLEHALAGRRTLLQFTGPPGTGKTRLLEETVRIAHHFGFDEPIFLDGRRLPPTDCCPPTAHPAPPAEAGSGQRARSTAEPPPLLLVIDNIDPAALRRLETVAGSLRYHTDRRFVLAIATCAAWSGARVFDQVSTIRLGALTDAAARALVAELIGAPPSDDLAEFVTDTGGNPARITELVLGLRTERRLHLVSCAASVRGDRLPARAISLLRQQFGRLSPACRLVVQAAAVLGETAYLECVGHVVGRPVSALVPAVEEATAAGILTRWEETVACRGRRARQVLLCTIPDATRHVLERKAAAVRVPSPGTAMHCPDTTRPLPPTGPAGAGPRASRHPAPAWQVLSDTEQRIAHLVSEGLTNRQIANRVLLSPHTVNYHLRRIFRKLGVGSRVALATIASNHRAPADQPAEATDSALA
ncbi:helix-turn-helix transcriptional regulator [Gandjariella thermophila]|uniref:helix-turn-helix transcriptional regulator n=1 Tax=Gandjariella thermophila TaxID=1931992 RepID=UPI001CEF6225|nr:LuxR family transcriptional regulator [Gandjariella thermophila]